MNLSNFFLFVFIYFFWYLIKHNITHLIIFLFKTYMHLYCVNRFSRFNFKFIFYKFFDFVAEVSRNRERIYL